MREWLCVAGSLAWTLIWLLQPDTSLVGQVVRASAVLLTGAFLAMTVYRPSADLSRALLATGAAALALASWTGVFGISWAAVSHGFERELWASNRTFVDQLSAAGTAAGGAGPLLDQLSAAASATAALLPALLVLAALAGLRLGWSWHHRIAVKPLGEPPARFQAFAFSDQLVWLLVAGLALTLVPQAPGWRAAAQNLLALGGALYAIRGLAVFSAGSGRLSRAGCALLTLVAMFLLPFVVGGLTLLGVADTWLDFRRRRATPAT
ncbi:MAG: DUF2232 domain-containing protein [Gemmatimonadales bacterium]|nr:DUF2232 domain-containing protein [Gemmatimonadales bacterium]